MSSRGFALIELMIVSAIIGILATIAIPNYIRFLLRAKSAEAKSNLQAIRTAAHAYWAAFGRYVIAPPSPPIYGGTLHQPFLDTGPPASNFDTVGWQPDGLIYFQYAVAVAGEAFPADAIADIDGNGVVQRWGYLQPDGVDVTVPGTLGCAGVWDDVTASATMTQLLGAFSPADGRSEF